MRKTRNEIINKYYSELEQVAALWDLKALEQFVKKWEGILDDDFLEGWEYLQPLTKEKTIIKVNLALNPNEKTQAKVEEYYKLYEEKIKTVQDYNDCEGLLQYLKGDGNA